MSVFSSPFNEPFHNPFGSPFNNPGIGGGAPSLTTQVAALFAAKSAKGYLIRLDAAGNLSQDAAGTVPVTMYTDPIGRVADLSGNNNHFTPIGAAGTRPLWDGLGGVFDGTDDGLVSPSIDLTTVTKFYVMVVAKKTGGLFNAATMGTSTSWSANNGAFLVTANAASVDRWGFNVRTTSNSGRADIAAVSGTTDSLLYKVDLTTAASLDAQLDQWRNGSSQAVGAGVGAAIGTLGNFPAYIGSIGASVKYANQFRGAILFGSTAFLTAPEEALLLAWGAELALP